MFKKVKAKTMRLPIGFDSPVLVVDLQIVQDSAGSPMAKIEFENGCVEKIYVFDKGSESDLNNTFQYLMDNCGVKLQDNLDKDGNFKFISKNWKKTCRAERVGKYVNFWETGK